MIVIPSTGWNVNAFYATLRKYPESRLTDEADGPVRATLPSQTVGYGQSVSGGSVLRLSVEADGFDAGDG